MNVDDFVKILLASGVTVSLVGVSIQIMRLINKVVQTLDPIRKVAEDFGEVSGQTLEDYRSIREWVISLKGLFKIPELIGQLGNLTSKFKSKPKPPKNELDPEE